jgi:hypothetical protein
MILKRFDSDSAIGCKRQERRGDALHFAPGLLPLNGGSNVHCFAFAAFNRSANGELL